MPALLKLWSFKDCSEENLLYIVQTINTGVIFCPIEGYYDYMENKSTEFILFDQLCMVQGWMGGLDNHERSDFIEYYRHYC